MLIPSLNEEIRTGNILVEIALTVIPIVLCLIAEKIIIGVVPEVFGKNCVRAKKS